MKRCKEDAIQVSRMFPAPPRRRGNEEMQRGYYRGEQDVPGQRQRSCYRAKLEELLLCEGGGAALKGPLSDMRRLLQGYGWLVTREAEWH